MCARHRPPTSLPTSSESKEEPFRPRCQCRKADAASISSPSTLAALPATRSRNECESYARYSNCHLAVAGKQSVEVRAWEVVNEAEKCDEFNYIMPSISLVGSQRRQKSPVTCSLHMYVSTIVKIVAVCLRILLLPLLILI